MDQQDRRSFDAGTSPETTGGTSSAGAVTTGAWETFRAAAAYALRPTRRNVLHWSSWVVALGVELALVVVLRSGHIFAWEQALTRRLQTVPGRQLIFDVTSTLTNTLSLPFLTLFLAIIALVLLSGHRGAAVLLAVSFPLHVLAQFPKALIDRPRPSTTFPGIEGVGGFQSFPSGHSEYVITFYGFLTYVVMLHIPSRWGRLAVLAGWLLFVLATGFGRIALGRHWPLDVLVSYIVGLGLLSGLIWLYSAFRNVKEQRALSAADHAPTVLHR